MWMKRVFLLLVLQTSAMAYTGPNPNGSPVIVPNSKTVQLPQTSGLPMPDVDNIVQTTRSVHNAGSLFATKQPSKKKDVGIDQSQKEYWFDQRIHTLGNVGMSGALHAAMAPLCTKIIDLAAHNGVNVRTELAQELTSTVNKKNARVVDLCCGVGCSTRAIKNAFPDAEVVAVDTSPTMLAMAEFIENHINTIQPLFQMASDKLSAVPRTMKNDEFVLKTGASRTPIHYTCVNAEDTELPSASFDLVTLFYVFHEAPYSGRNAMLKEARRLLAPGGTLAVVDISPDFTPSKSMLMGEPYIQEYQRNIHSQMEKMKGFQSPHYRTVVPCQVGMWTLQRSAKVKSST